MRAIVLTRYGGPEVLRVSEVPDPSPRAGEVRVRVRTIGVNFAEVLSRRGVYGWAPKLPYILGMEAFGEIDRVGEGVTTHRPGDAVIVGTKFGAYAELVCVPADQALPAPARFTPQQSAAFAVNYLTAWIGLTEMARLRPSDTLLVTSAAGGVGTAAVQIGKKLGARVIGVASASKLETLRELGADLALAYDELSRLPAVDVVLEMAGGDTYRAALAHLAPMGRMVVAGASGSLPRSRNLFARLAALRNLPRPSIFDMLSRSYGVMSFHVGRLMESGAVMRQFRELVEFAEANELTPLVDRELPFDQIADAHRLLEERRNAGKVVVRV